ncbi:hypothetical protein D3C86_1337820 [compost metagenome]
MLLDIQKVGINATLRIPMEELQTINPELTRNKERKTFTEDRNAWLDAYLLDHLSISNSEGYLWKIRINDKHISHNELTYDLWFQPPSGSSLRDFTLHYNAIIHQLRAHKLFLKVSSDWYGGMKETNGKSADLGILMADPLTGALDPLEIHLENEASLWNGFKVFVEVGMEQIKSGTDHILFLVVLMLSTALTAQNGRWTNFAGSSILIRVLKIATAFTLGYPFSLVMGAMHWLILPQRFVEVAIAGTILITAIHAIRPVFPRKEAYVAILFGVIHGLGFSGAIADLNLDGERLVYSTLGFSVGVELMQLFIILCVVPWFVLLSKYRIHKIIRISAGTFAIVASVAWIITRIADRPNIISNYAESILSDGKWLIAGLVFLAILNEVYQQVRERKASSERIG